MKTTSWAWMVLLLVGCGNGFETVHGNSAGSSGWSQSDAADGDTDEDSAVPDAAEAEADAIDEDASPADGGTDEDSAVPDAAEADAQEASLDATGDVDSAAPPDAQEDSEVDAPPDSEDGPCVPTSCEQAGKDCGPMPDGCGVTLDCGSCSTNMSCGGGGVPNVCGGCVPITCSSVPQFCGPLVDGCGNTLDCGPYKRGYDPSCQSPSKPYNWYCSPEQYWAPPPFPGCVQNGWPGSYCCAQGS
jgi:hypothetical protein